MSQPKRPRRAPAGGYARGDETRQRIIDAAIRLFGEHGFAGASTRDIAAAAGVNPPALQYYFESKEGVYNACAQFILLSSRPGRLTCKAGFTPYARWHQILIKLFGG